MSDASKRVTVSSRHGFRSIDLEARVTETGDILMEGQDVSDASSEIFGDSDYVYWLTVRKDNKDVLLEKLIDEPGAVGSSPDADRDRAILALIKERFSGADASSAFMAWLKRRNVPFEFHS
ncbi:MAG: hypothetical protein ACRDJ5_00290 [Actinomycetota bacterium]